MSENVRIIMTHLEIEESYKGLLMPSGFSSIRVSRQSEEDIHKTNRTEMNWVTKGHVTAVQDQSGCASCWAFSATGAMEAAFKRNSPNTDVVDLSESNLVNCLDEDVCRTGSNPLHAFEYVSINGIATEDEIPYQAVKGQCNNKKTKNELRTSNPFEYKIKSPPWDPTEYSESNNMANIDDDTQTTNKNPTGYTTNTKATSMDQLNTVFSWAFIKDGEKYLQEIVETVGPVSCLICAKSLGVHLNDGGVFDDKNCSQQCNGLARP